MSEHAPHAAPHADGGHDDPMSHVPPGSPWPLLFTIALTVVPFGVLLVKGSNPLSFDAGNIKLEWLDAILLDPLNRLFADKGLAIGWGLVGLGGLWFLYALMGWASQIIREKVISHDVVQQQTDLKQFIAMFLVGELAVFGAIFGYLYHRLVVAQFWPAQTSPFGPPEGMHLGGAIVAYATFILISSSATCEIAHRALEHGRRELARWMLIATLVLGIIFLGFQGLEYGELIARGFTPKALADAGFPQGASFASLFYTSTGFHGLHVAIGLVMLFMVLLRLQFGHFYGKRHFSMIAASWYWHFVDIVWILLFISVYVVV